MPSDAAWAAIASIITSVTTLIAVLVGNRKSSVIEQKVTTPNGDPRTLAEIISEAHPAEETNKTPGT